MLPNFGHMTTSTIKFESHDLSHMIFVGNVMDGNYDVINYKLNESRHYSKDEFVKTFR